VRRAVITTLCVCGVEGKSIQRRLQLDWGRLQFTLEFLLRWRQSRRVELRAGQGGVRTGLVMTSIHRASQSLACDWGADGENLAWGDGG
jgi:hypothetical protein